MIASQKIGKSFIGALNYNLQKMNHPDINRRAKLLDTNFDCDTLEQVKKEVELLRELRPNLNRYVYHTSLNFAVEDEAFLSNEKLLAIAHDYLEENGFNNNQYLIFRHYDAGHPHVHLLVNRIRFDGSVVSDSNNYQRSEAILRKLELRYNLTTVAPSKDVTQRAAKKDEIEMVLRTGKPSEKMLLQEKLRQLTSHKNINLQTLIQQGEARGIHFLFNQASTGKITGITYFHNGFKIKGKVLGNQFKWSELLKRINYEQVRDSKAVSEANSRTTAIYGDGTSAGERITGHRIPSGSDQLLTGGAGNFEVGAGEWSDDQETATAGYPGRERSLDTGQDADLSYPVAADHEYYGNDHIDFPQISDDVDDEAVYGKSRRRGRGR